MKNSNLSSFEPEKIFPHYFSTVSKTGEEMDYNARPGPNENLEQHDWFL